MKELNPVKNGLKTFLISYFCAAIPLVFIPNSILQLQAPGSFLLMVLISSFICCRKQVNDTGKAFSDAQLKKVVPLILIVHVLCKTAYFFIFYYMQFADGPQRPVAIVMTYYNVSLILETVVMVATFTRWCPRMARRHSSKK